VSDDPRDAIGPEENETLSRAFSEQLLACLDECARGRRGLFSSPVNADEEESIWSEALRLRELAVALQGILAQQGERNALCADGRTKAVVILRISGAAGAERSASAKPAAMIPGPSAMAD
jgi:hypothetical protein